MLKKILLITLFTIAVSAAQAADTTNKSKNNQTANSTIVASAQTGQASKVLKKQQRVDGGTTTWSKIKDLFN
jgi:hypothetical protein